MTVSQETPTASSVANGVTTVFPYAFTVLQATDLVVQGVLAGVTTIYTLGVDYTLTGVGTGSGSVVFAIAPANLTVITRYRDSAIARDTDYQDNGDLLADTVNLDFDRMWLVLQEIFNGGKGAPTSLRVPNGETVPALPAAADRANKVLAFDSSGNPVVSIPASGSAAAVLLALAATGGAALIGTADAGNWFDTFTAEGGLQELANPRGKFQVDGVNVLRYIPPAEWPAIANGTSVTDLYVYLQSALTAEKNLKFPDGLFNTGTTLIAQTGATIRGINRRGAILKGTTPITILRSGVDSFDLTVERIYFKGTGCTGISSSTGGSFPSYGIRLHIEECDFARDLAFGINTALIFFTCSKSTFGYYGDIAAPAPGASTFCAIRSFNAGALNTNLNRVTSSIFHFSGGLTLPALDLSSGAGWIFDGCDFEFGGAVLSASNIQLLKFTNACWFEGNKATNRLFLIGACNVAPIFENCGIYGNDTPVLWGYSTGSTKGLVIRHNDIGLIATGFPLLDSTTLVQTLPGDGTVTWHDNNVSSGAAGNKVITATDFRGGPSPRVRGTAVSTSGPSASITSCVDAGVGIVRNAAGDVTLSGFSNPLAAAANRIVAKITPYGGSATQFRVFPNTTTSVQIQFFTAAGAAVDTAFSFEFSGA